MKRLIPFCILFFFLAGANAYPYWIWTPKTGRWTNPKTDVKGTPAQQLAFAKGLYDAKNYEEAKKEFTKILRKFPKAAEAAESQFYLGLIEEAQDNPYEAFISYQKVVEKYPFSERITEIIERQFKIGDAFMAGKKRKALGMDLPVDNPAIEIYEKVVANAPFGPYAAQAQYKLGIVYKNISRYFEAEEAFSKVITEYPESEWATAAKYQLAATRAMEARSSAYDQGSTLEAKKKFEDFVREHPEVDLSREAQKSIQQLSEKEAESSFSAGKFYERQKDYQSARIYYDDIIKNYPDSPWAVKALERISIIDKRESR